MTLIQTVTQIIGKPVTETEAKDFALNNFGLLATFIRENKPTNYLKGEEKIKITEMMKRKEATAFDSILSTMYSVSTLAQQRSLEDAFPETFQYYLNLLKQEENVPDNQSE